MEIAEKEEQRPIGVLIGRFQVHKLHAAHVELIRHVVERHSKVLIFLGVSPTTPSKRNPLDFKSRELMIKAVTGMNDVVVLPIVDQPSDVLWSQELDLQIRLAAPFGAVMLYGSRDSFINHYSGHFPTTTLESKKFVSGTEVRKNVADKWFGSSDFRAGVIYGAYNRHPVVYPTVDVAILKDHMREVLLARKPNERGYRFVGGFVDPKDDGFKAAAKREAYEETSLEVDNLRYVASLKVDDWRYRSEDDKIITTLFAADYIYGAPKPQDDISELAWFDINSFDEDDLESVHRPLWDELWRYIKTERTNDNGKEHSSTDRLVQTDALADVSTRNAIRDVLP